MEMIQDAAIGDGHAEHLAVPGVRNDAQAVRDIGGHPAHGLLRGADEHAARQRRDRELLRQNRQETIGVHVAQVQQTGAQEAVVLPLQAQGVVELRPGDEAFADEDQTQGFMGRHEGYCATSYDPRQTLTIRTLWDSPAPIEMGSCATASNRSPTGEPTL